MTTEHATLPGTTDMRILSRQDDLDAFRAAVREWLAETVPPDAIQQMIDADEAEGVRIQREWMAARHTVGLGTPHWPKEYGGADLSLAHQIILAEEFARTGAPVIPAFMISLNHLPGTLLSWGTEEQKSRYLPGIPAGDIWCQGFSEPGAGSDLASLRTRAERKGDRYVINGQKIWSSMAMYAKYCILLARTDPDAPKHKGISFFLMDMSAPGVEVRPIEQVNGRSEFAELFLTDVEIPAENLVGPENGGWKVAQSTLASERGVIAFEYIERARYAVESFFADAVANDAAWLKDDQLRREFIDQLVELQANRRLLRRLLRGNAYEHAAGDTLPSYIKLHGSLFRQAYSSLLTRLDGLDGQRFKMGFEEVYLPAMFTFVSSFSWTIAGGSNEIMRNLIAERGLGMPRD
jgi:alkylation response protein AidB-like acyl-CoA dehydrogenase